MFCNNCGVEVPDGKRYCNNCGKKLDVKGSSERVEKRKSKCINHNRIKNKRSRGASGKTNHPKFAFAGIAIAIIAMLGLGTFILNKAEESHNAVTSHSSTALEVPTTDSEQHENNASAVEAIEYASEEAADQTSLLHSSASANMADNNRGDHLSDDSIMGPSRTTIDQMVQRFNSTGHSYPTAIYDQYGAPTIEDFCTILYEEANSEYVRAEVVFAQTMIETGWLQFGGSVYPEQCNFAGLGAFDGSSGATFNNYGNDSVRMGLRAQVQHLKAYASHESLNNECIDPRFSLVTRGSAPSVYDLSGTWAADPEMGTKIMNQIIELLS